MQYHIGHWSLSETYLIYRFQKLAVFSSSKASVMKPILLGVLHLCSEILSG